MAATAAPGPAPEVVARPRRPRDRKQQIIAAAAVRFWTLGYHRVGMADIAAAVGIGPSALYRHFRSKQELLLAVLDAQLTAIENGVAAGVADLPEHALDNREFGALWEREARHLPEPEHRAIRHRLRALAARVAEAIAAEAGPGGSAELRAWAALSVVDSPTHHHLDLDRARFVALLRGAAQAVTTAALPPTTAAAPRPGPDRPVLLPATRREALLAVAIRLFGERGYPSVGLSDIGAAAGIAGPSVYNHFESKTDILVAALQRGNESLWMGLHHALARAADATGALDLLVADYTAFTLANPHIIGILLSEVTNLPDSRRDAFRRTQLDYVAEWVALLVRSRPELDAVAARALVHAALSVVNDVTRVHHLQHRPELAQETALLARAVLRAVPAAP
ncbi:TetR/AcrR family transcriptional regulator [Pseudonocardia humida]|uniref:TetR/AcrR family transcriptional regulator n=1 Tax=Pseudonocardia humida TaxID=2800819 RepID=A0ABT1A077_9PSEU|nr:TetR/AcrR family transcriptional regulator [Pseudonocardia humida]MCO1656410.1 TetR/AcrR family transcriptional regulator [Pseudonocardia humida]